MKKKILRTLWLVFAWSMIKVKIDYTVEHGDVSDLGDNTIKYQGRAFVRWYSPTTWLWCFVWLCIYLWDGGVKEWVEYMTDIMNEPISVGKRYIEVPEFTTVRERKRMCAINAYHELIQ